MQTKICRRCKEDLDLDHFRRNKLYKDGLHYLCRLCDHRFRNGEFKATPKYREPGDPVERFWARVEKTEDCWIWRGTVRPDGFGSFGYTDNKRAYNSLAHRFSYALHFTPPPARTVVYQECENKLCVRPEHLLLPNYDKRWSVLMAKRATRKKENEKAAG